MAGRRTRPEDEEGRADDGCRGSERLAEALRDAAARWCTTTHDATYGRLAERERTRALKPVVLALTAALGDGGPRARSWRARIVEAARQHGESRAREGVSIDLLPQEYGAMRRALPEVVTHGDCGVGEVDFNAWIDELLSVATSAAMFGYHRALSPDRGEAIDDALRRLSAPAIRKNPRSRE